jgi:hypothetical protein
MAAWKKNPIEGIVSSSSSGGGGDGGDGGGGFIDKVKQIKEALGIRAAMPKEAIGEANQQMGLPTEGPLPEQVDALMAKLGLL